MGVEQRGVQGAAAGSDQWLFFSVQVRCPA